MDIGLLILRLVVGTIMAVHGAQKLWGWFGGYGLAGTGGWLESLGFKPGRLHAGITGWSELGGGLLLMLGLFTPLGAAAVMGVMIVAVATVHWDKGFFNTAGGYEFNFMLMGAATALAFTGGGPVSLDRALGLDLSGPLWGLSAIALATAGAFLILSLRRVARSPEQPVAGEEVIDLRDDEAAVTTREQ